MRKSRAEALKHSEPFYNTGKPCKHGHISKRDTKKGVCVECKKSHEKENPRPPAYFSIYYKDNNGKAQKEYKKKHKNRVAASAKKYRENNLQLYAYHENLRRARKLERTPKWADLQAIKDFYLACPKGMHVDHIIPIKGKLVSGLHTIENLQYLTPKENLEKSNKF